MLDANTVCLEAAIITYGKAASQVVSEQMNSEISTMLAEPRGRINIDNKLYTLVVNARDFHHPTLSPKAILNNCDPYLDYFRIEHFVNGNISFVNAINSNTGIFKLENLYEGSTTAAHEFGHTIGL